MKKDLIRIGFIMLSKLYKIMMNEVNFVGCGWAIAPISPPWIRLCALQVMFTDKTLKRQRRNLESRQTQDQNGIYCKSEHKLRQINNLKIHLCQIIAFTGI